MLTQEKLQELLDYDHFTGMFYWKVASSRSIKVGSNAPALEPTGYIRIRIYHKNYLAHRLVWLYVYGSFPKDNIDHINGIRNDNRLSNLREATTSQNGMNIGKQSNNTSGYKGVFWHKGNKKWYAQIRINKKSIHLGSFDNILDADAVYKLAAIKFHGEFTNV